MGKAVVDNRGRSPLRRFRSDLSWIVHADLSRITRRLLDGQAVTNDVDGVTITQTAGGSGEPCELVVRHGLTAERVRIMIRSVRSTELRALGLKKRKLDRRGLPTRAPGPWRQTLHPNTDDEKTVWELFNCVVMDVDPLGSDRRPP